MVDNGSSVDVEEVGIAGVVTRTKD